MLTQFGPGAVGSGWEGGFLGLDLYLADSAVPKDATDWIAWPGFEAGRAFFTTSAKA